MISTQIKNVELEFETDPQGFSPHRIDAGTLAMLSVTDFHPGERILDVGCGYGVVGILAAKLAGQENVILCDISEGAVERARANARRNQVPELEIRVSDAFSAVPERDFALILSNPPYHADFSVPRRFIEEGFKRLAVGGRMVMVTKRLDWYKNKLTAVFGGVKVYETDGYHVFVAHKRASTVKKKDKTAGKLSKKLQRKQGRKENRKKAMKAAE